MITFTLWGAHGELGIVTIPAPKTWWRRWLLRFASKLWNAVAAVESQRPPSRAFAHCSCELHDDIFGCHHEPHPSLASVSSDENIQESLALYDSTEVARW